MGIIVPRFSSIFPRWGEGVSSRIPNRPYCVFASRGVVDTIGESTMLLDISGNGNHIPVVSGTVFSDLVVNVPTGHALAGVGPFTADTDVALADHYGNTDDVVFLGNQSGARMVAYSVEQTAITRIFNYVRYREFTPAYQEDGSDWLTESGDTVYQEGTAL